MTNLAQLGNAATVVAVALLMILAAIDKGSLEPRRPGRTCPACGREIRICNCR
jgi:hypothetical protein